MASLSNINIRFSVDLREFSQGLQNSLRDINKASQQLQSVGRGLSAAVTLPLAGLGIASLKTFGDIQALQKGLISVMGSAEAAAIEFEKLKEVAKLPGLGLEEAVRGSVNLQAAGFSADEARRALLSFGNALATVGKGKRELDLVTLAITQLQNKNSGFGQDLRQLTEQLPQLRGALQSAFGTVDTEKISKSGVTGKQVVNALITEFEKLPKVTGGLNNSFENFADSTKLALSSFGESINKAFNVEGLLNSLSEAIGNLAERFSNLSPEVQRTILVISGIAAAIGPLLLTLGVIGSTIPRLVTGFITLRTAVINFTASLASNPFGAIAVAIGLVAGAYFLFNQETEKAITKVDTLNQLNQQAAQVISAQKSQLEQFLSVARDDTKSKSEREKAIRSLNKISPEYLGNLRLETINTDEAKNSIERYNVALLEAGKAKAAQSALQSNYTKQLEAELKFENATAGSFDKIVAAQKKLNEARGTDKYFETLSEVNKLVKDQQNVLEATLDPLKKEEGIILSVFNKYKDKLGLLKDISEVVKKEGEDIIKAGTIEFYEMQISALRKTQKSVVDNFDAWNILESKIKDYQKQIDIIEGKAGIKLPKPEVDLSDPVDAPSFSLKDLKDQQSYFEGLREQYATTSEEYAKLTEQINNTTIKINAIEGVDEAVTQIEVVKTQLQTFSESVSEAMNNAVASFAEGFGQVIANFANGGDLLSNVGNLFLGTLANMMIQVGKIAIQTGIAITGIKKALQSLNPALAIGAGIALIALGTLVKSQVADAGAFANGGIVGGTSFAGDRLFARVNSGEMILNQKQQSNLNRMINPAVTAGDVAIQLMGGFDIEGDKLRLVLDRSDKKKNRIG